MNKLSKFNKSVELAKSSIEEYCLAHKYDFSRDYNIHDWGVTCPSDVDSVIFDIGGGEWYGGILRRAGYSETTIYRKVMNMDYDKFENKLDGWYKTELYPKVVEELKKQEPELYENALRRNIIKLNELKQINN